LFTIGIALAWPCKLAGLAIVGPMFTALLITVIFVPLSPPHTTLGASALPSNGVTRIIHGTEKAGQKYPDQGYDGLRFTV